MTAKAILVLVGAAVVIAVGAILGTRPPETPRAPSPRAPAPAAASTEGPKAWAIADAFATLQDKKARRVRAQALRRMTLSSDDALAAAVRVLNDPKADRRVREAVAVVLGSLPGQRGRRPLLEALGSGALKDIERAAILALGIRSLEDGHEFERDGMPYAVEAAEGLVVYVRDPVRDDGMRAEIERRLAETSPPEVRKAAALVLRDSAIFPDVREAFLARVGGERDSETAAEGAAALASWARSVPPGESDRARIVDRITEALPQGDELFRFRLLSTMGEASLTPAESARIRGMLGAPDPDVRLFAADVLGRRLESNPGRDPEAIPSLVRALSSDTVDAVREAAALALGRASGDAPAREALLRALRSDVDWEVRAAAARALGSHPTSASVAALEEAAARDPRLEVRKSAERSLALVRPK